MLKRILTKEEHEKLESHYQTLYKEVDDKFVFSGVPECSHENILKMEGVIEKQKTQAKAYRSEISTIKSELETFTNLGVDIDDLTTMVNDFPTLEANASKDNTDAINTAVEKKVSLLASRHKKEIDKRDKDLEKLQTQLSEANEVVRVSTINSALDIALEKSGVRSEAKDTVRFMGKNLFDIDEEGVITATMDLNGAKAGMSPEEVLSAWKTTNSFLWGETNGGGSTGSTSGNGRVSNAWDRDHGQPDYSEESLNLQRERVKNDPVAAAQEAKAAGTSVGGLPPKSK